VKYITSNLLPTTRTDPWSLGEYSRYSIMRRLLKDLGSVGTPILCIVNMHKRAAGQIILEP